MGALAVEAPVHGTAYVTLREAMTLAMATKQNTS